jgi:tetratricopeptide (TPR) repeat protein
MTLFLGSQVAATDPRLAKTYDYFARNLSDIIRLGREAGAGVVVSTVAVNLKDCAPFASAHRPGLPAGTLEQWNRSYQSGIEAQKAGHYALAAREFADAARSDDAFADLRFRQGQCALALRDVDEARRQLTAARDCDTLRFRCDSQLNAVIRRGASDRAGQRVLLADAEQAFAAESPDHLAGAELFYEHVHLNFDGNYLLARVITQEAEKLLPERFAAPRASAPAWPSEAQCARRLGWSGFSRLKGVKDILSRLRNPPFTNQSNHEDQMRRLSFLAQELAPAGQPAGLRQAEGICQEALAAAPDDPQLNFQWALLKARFGDLPGAVAALERDINALPTDDGAWANLGIFLSQEQKFHEAATAFQRAIALDPLDASLWERMAESFWKSGQTKEAERCYRQALSLQPAVGVIWLELGQLLEQSGRKAQADDSYQRALLCPGKILPDFVTLAHFCRGRSWYLAASTNYLAAIRLDPSDVRLRLEAGDNFASLGRNDLAEEQFRQALLLQPDSITARLNLAVALMKQNRGAEALAELEIILRQDPTNASALQYSAQLRQAGVTVGVGRP